jgi:multidrug efflux system membrane fusion protein
MTRMGRRRRRVGRVVVIVVAVLAVGAVVTATTGLELSRSSNGSAPRSQVPSATEKVTRQTLVDVQTEDGELGYGDATTVSCRLSGTLTALAAAGSVVERGQTLYRVDDTPVVLLYGALPAYRTLAVNVEGADVKQFEQNLRALGYTGFTVDDEYSATTATAVRKWQKTLGLPQTGTVDLGRVVFAAGAVRVDSHESVVGDAVGPGTAVMAGTGTTRVIVVELDMSDRRLARQDAGVSVKLPNGEKVDGKITKIETVIDTSGGDSAGGAGGEGGSSDPVTKIEATVTVADEKAFAGLDDANVDVSFTASRREDVLTVPVAALLALVEGGYGVQVVDGTSTSILPVKTGLFADGRVEVSGDGLTEGMTVGMPS